jgi:hypothetical protein
MCSSREVPLREDARSALECGSEAKRSCRLRADKNKAAAPAAALHGIVFLFAGLRWNLFSVEN